MNTERVGEGIDRLITPVAAVFAVVLSAWVILYAYQPLLPARQHANVVLGIGLAVYYFLHAHRLIERDPDTPLKKLNVGVVLLLGVLSLVATGYVHVSYFRWLEAGRLLVYTNLDLLVGLALIYVVTDATFRNYGTILGLVIVLSMVYGYTGQYLPGLLGHAGLTVEQIIRRQTITLTGIYGFLLQVGATWIAIFVVFAGMMESYGGFDYINELGARIKEHSRSGIAQTAVISSMFMGTMMGSAASNVATTGSFTIPLMEEHGLSPRLAAATEAVASTGGQILPPIMGTAAFLMANILGISFAKVAIAGVIPALLFYGATAIGVHYTVVGRGLYEVESEDETDHKTDRGIELDRGTQRRWFLIRGLQYLVPLLVLIYTLMVLQLGPLAAGLYTTGSVVVARAVRQAYGRNVREFLYETVDGLRTGGENLAPFLAILASLGIVINIFGITGLAQRIAFELLDIAGGSFVLVLVITMVVCLLLGLGIPTPAAYVLVATILGPVLVKAGLTELSAHFFIFYFALLSSLTPPVALAVAVAVGISGTDFIKTAKEALVLGGPVYFIPFMFVFQPSILEWTFPRTLIATVFFSIAVLALVHALTGFNGSHRLSIPMRGLAAGFFIVIAFAPSTSAQLAAAVVFVAMVAYTSNVTVSDLTRRSA